MRYILVVFLLSISLFLPFIQRQGTNTTVYVSSSSGPLENIWFSVTYHLPDGSKKLVEGKTDATGYWRHVGPVGATFVEYQSIFAWFGKAPDKNGVYFHEFHNSQAGACAANIEPCEVGKQ